MIWKFCRKFHRFHVVSISSGRRLAARTLRPHIESLSTERDPERRELLIQRDEV